MKNPKEMRVISYIILLLGLVIGKPDCQAQSVKEILTQTTLSMNQMDMVRIRVNVRSIINDEGDLVNSDMKGEVIRKGKIYYSSFNNQVSIVLDSIFLGIDSESRILVAQKVKPVFWENINSLNNGKLEEIMSEYLDEENLAGISLDDKNPHYYILKSGEVGEYKKTQFKIEKSSYRILSITYWYLKSENHDFEKTEIGYSYTTVPNSYTSEKLRLATYLVNSQGKWKPSANFSDYRFDDYLN